MLRLFEKILPGVERRSLSIFRLVASFSSCSDVYRICSSGRKEQTELIFLEASGWSSRAKGTPSTI
jgi:hypothetical protein